MATKQRSFFDHKPQKSNQWHNKRPFPISHAPQYSSKPPAARSPITASSQSRSKLKAFRYETPRIVDQLRDAEGVIMTKNKENERPWTSGSPGNGSQDVAQKSGTQQKHPQTPITRIPFADLLNNAKEATEHSPLCTPADSVTWKYSPRSSGTESASSPRGKKRARSSSPVSSGRANLTHFPGLAHSSADLHALPNVQPDAQADSALDIESRYFSMLNTPSRPPATAAADMMHSSSPQTPDLRSDSARLRRTMSCGVAYPSSRKKRVKFSNDSRRDTEKSPVRKQRKEKRGQATTVSALLEKIELARHSGNGPLQIKPLVPSSAPFPAYGRAWASRPTASSQPLNVRAKQAAISPQHAQFEHVKRVREDLLQPPETGQNTSSDYGGEDLETDLVEDIDKSCLPNITVQATGQSQLRQHEAIFKATDDRNDDPDDDEDMDDVFAADLEVLASKYDNAPPKTNNVSTTVSQAYVENVAAKEPKESIDVSSDEEFGGDNFDDLAEEFNSLTQAAENNTPHTSSNNVILRFVVKAVSESHYKNKRDRLALENVLHVQEHRTEKLRLVSLRESWTNTNCPIGAFVHVLGQFDCHGRCVIDNAHGLITVHPDHLLSATSVADASVCIRKAVLQDRVKATNEASESQVYGNILHEIFQEALQANRWDDEWFEKTARSVAIRHMEALFELNLTLDLAMQHLLGRVVQLQSWAKRFLGTENTPGAYIKDRGGVLTPATITKLLDVEEHVWSPLYGLKGNIDATVQISAQEKGRKLNLTVPLELKTGRKRQNEPNFSHISQTALYTLLLSDRYDIDIAYGILYYLETSEMSRIPGLRLEIMGMLQQRNEIASYARDKQHLPDMRKNEHTCGHCYAKTPCFVYHKLLEDGNGKSSGLGQKFKNAMEHLQPVHAEFFKKWDTLLTKEEGDAMKFRKELWTMTSVEREKAGRCFGNIVIRPGSESADKERSKINRYEYVFIKPDVVSSFSFTESQINVGDPIVISDERGHFALANGYMTKIRRHEITVTVDRRLHNARTKSKDFDAKANQSFAGIMNVETVASPQIQVEEESLEVVLYRLDKDEFSNGMATVRNNLIRIMEKDLFGARTLRQLVVENVAPVFLAPPPTLKKHFEDTENELNVDQQNAVTKVMEAKDYALVLGMPGTGKTTTIAHIIRALVASGKSVLLTSYTHAAVDNILLKFRNDKLSILRIGTEARVHPSVKDFADVSSITKATFEEVEKSYKSQVVATTCLSINHPIFNQRTFDYCIVDEASQITLPVCLGPIRMAHHFVLVGDHYQLPPLVKNQEAQKGGLDVSLFKLLSERHPESVVNLEHQYRMCEEIMSLSNTLIYHGKLKCGTAIVAGRTLTIPNISALAQHHHTPSTLGPGQSSICLGASSRSCWLSDILAPSQRVVFINTDLIGATAREIAHGSRTTNPLEVAVAAQLVRALLTVGVPSTEVGIITPYVSQVSILKHAVRSKAGGVNAAVETDTADKYQGRDKEVIIFSLVRSNECNNVGELLQDWRRINVALTRAKSKLIILGSFGTISRGCELLGKLCSLIDQNDWRYDLKPKALNEHLFEEPATQFSGLTQTREEAIVSDKKNYGLLKSQNIGQQARVAGKTGRMDSARLLKSRPILRDIVNELGA